MWVLRLQCGVADITRIEVDGQILLAEGFELRGSRAYLDSEFDQFPNGPTQVAQGLAGLTSQDLSGQGTTSELALCDF